MKFNENWSPKGHTKLSKSGAAGAKVLNFYDFVGFSGAPVFGYFLEQQEIGNKIETNLIWTHIAEKRSPEEASPAPTEAVGLKSGFREVCKQVYVYSYIHLNVSLFLSLSLSLSFSLLLYLI